MPSFLRRWLHFSRFIEAKYPRAEIDVVEIDPEITRVSLTYLGCRRGQEFELSIRMAVGSYEQSPEENYDFVFMDASMTCRFRTI